MEAGTGQLDARGRAERLRRVAAVGRQVVSELDTERVLRLVLDAARELTGARYAAVGILSEDRNALARFVWSGLDDHIAERIGKPPTGRGVLGVLIREPRPLRLDEVGSHPRSYGFPLGHPPMHGFLGVPVSVRGEAWGNLYLTEKQGGFDEDDEEVVVALADWAAIAIENARLYRLEHARRGELERAVRALETTSEIAIAVGGETRLERVLELLTKRARALVEARSLAIALVDGDDLVVSAMAGEHDAAAIGSHVAIPGSRLEGVLRSGRPAALPDLAADEWPAASGSGPAAPNLFVPMAFHGQPVGLVCAVERLVDGPAFNVEDERLLLAFAAVGAMAISTAQDVQRETLRRSIASAEQERARWARELHDETLQDLGALKLALDIARRGKSQEATPAVLADTVAQLETTIAGLRSIVTDLRPAALDALGTKAALETLAERMRRRSGLEIVLGLDLAFERGEAERHTEQLESTVYRVVQEALTNAAKHSGASRVRVDVVEQDGVVEVRVHDDGRGFHTADDTGGFGLLGMRERVSLVGGSLAIASAPGEGTEVHVVLPLARRAGGGGA
jgi:signal transduction histidine kinase